MFTVTKSFASNFPNGLKAHQLSADINSTISTTCAAINRSNDVISLIFESEPSSGELDTVNTLISEHIPEPNIFDELHFETVNTNSKITKKSLYVDTTSGNITVTLPAVSRTNGAVLGIKKTKAANNVTVLANGSDQINSLASVDLTTINSFLLLKNDGTQWVDANPNINVSIAENSQLLSVTDSKGQLSVETGSGLQPLTVGSNGQVLTADSTQELGMKWATVSGGGNVFGSDFQYQESLTEYTTSSGSYVTAMGSDFTTFGPFTGQYIIKCYFELGESNKHKYVNAIVRRTDTSENLTGELVVGSSTINYTTKYVEKIIILSGETPAFDIRINKGDSSSVSIRNIRWTFHRML